MAAILGSGEHRYRVLDNWAKLPDGRQLTDVASVASVAVDSKDRDTLLAEAGARGGRARWKRTLTASRATAAMVLHISFDIWALPARSLSARRSKLVSRAPGSRRYLHSATVT